MGSLNADYGYTAGLLHAIGRLALFRHAPEEYPALSDPSKTRATEAFERERERYGVDRAELSRQILVHWGLPVSLQQAIARHHLSNGTEPLTAAVQAGCYYAEFLGFGGCGCCLQSCDDAAAGPSHPIDAASLKHLAIEVNRIEIDCAIA